jgi:uncharacterized protein
MVVPVELVSSLQDVLLSQGPLIIASLIGLGILYVFFKESKKTVSSVEIAELFIYPIKSCRGVKMAEAEITPTGLIYDRQFAVMNQLNEVVTLKSRPKMATVVPSFSSDGERMIISAPDQPSVEVPLKDLPLTPAQCRLRLRIWDDQADVYEVDPEVSEWFAKALDVTGAKFVRLTNAFAKPPTEPNLASKGKKHQRIVSLADPPFLAISEESLIDFNNRLPHPIPALSHTTQRFRPNIVVRGCVPYAEDQWEAVVTCGDSDSAGVRLTHSMLCDRCSDSVPNVHPTKGVMDTGLLISRTLKKYRSGKHLKMKSAWDEKLFFGMSLRNDNGASGMIAVGDRLEVIAS